MRTLSASLILSCVCLLPTLRAGDEVPASSAAEIPVPVAARMQVSCYFPSWATTAEQVPYDRLDQIYYSFLRPTATGDFEPIRNPEVLKDLVRRGHGAGVKVSIAVGGALDRMAPAFAALAADPDTRARFIQNLLAFVETNELDGVDIDWEYPVAGVSDQDCGLLMQELSAVLRPRGKLVSMAVPGDSKKPNYPDAIFPAIDHLNVMVYDRGRPQHASFDYAVASLDYWTGRGCPAEKIMLGVPFYSRSATAEPLAYRELRELGADADADLFTDPKGNIHGYNGRATLRAKVALARERGVGGMMIWEIMQDTRGDDSLLAALRDAIANPPPVAAGVHEPAASTPPETVAVDPAK